MRILLDENMPRKLLAALAGEGHEVDSVKSMQLQGIDNGALYQFAASNYDLCFTRDAEFSRRVQSQPTARLRLVHVIIPQTRQDEFVLQFLAAFLKTDWSSHKAATIGLQKFTLDNWRPLPNRSAHHHQRWPQWPRAPGSRDDSIAETRPIVRCDNLVLLDVIWDFDTP